MTHPCKVGDRMYKKCCQRTLCTKTRVLTDNICVSPPYSLCPRPCQAPIWATIKRKFGKFHRIIIYQEDKPPLLFLYPLSLLSFVLRGQVPWDSNLPGGSGYIILIYPPPLLPSVLRGQVPSDHNLPGGQGYITLPLPSFSLIVCPEGSSSLG